jgi:hypothetical protein
VSSTEVPDRTPPGNLAAKRWHVTARSSARSRIAAPQSSQDYYIIGFAPAGSAGTNGERAAYRRVQVKVNRPGAHASVRTGYSLGPQPTSNDKRRAIDMGLGAPYTQPGLRVEYTTYARAGDTPGVQRVYLVLSAETPVATDTAKNADVAFVVRDAKTGRIAASATDTMPLPRQNAQGRATAIANYRVQFDLPPAEYLMRAGAGTRRARQPTAA